MENSEQSSTAPRPRRTSRGRLHTHARERVLREVELRGSATIAELAEATNLHENTIRGHLDSLQSDGFLNRSQEKPIGRGRPAIRWTPVDPQVANPYMGLAATLAGTLTDFGARSAAREAGKAWGERLAERHASGSSATKLVSDVMREQGFDPHQDESTVHLRRCPLLAVAAQQPEVVCAVHEGMLEGIANSHTPGLRAKLTPFAPDGTCILRIQDEP